MSTINASHKWKTALLSVMMISITGAISGCSQSEPSVLCQGVGKAGNGSVLMAKGMCAKLAGGIPLTTNQVYKDPGADAYVECYGVAAAGENDCATNTSACGGTTSVDRSAAAWIAIPKGICEQLKGGIVGDLSKTNVGPNKSSTKS
jgi:uncharacterized membrane protein